jgi:hypothetical protein
MVYPYWGKDLDYCGLGEFWSSVLVAGHCQDPFSAYWYIQILCRAAMPALLINLLQPRLFPNKRLRVPFSRCVC